MIFFRKHTLFTLYCTVFMLLLIGVIATSGTTYLLPLFIYFSSFLAVYFFTEKVFRATLGKWRGLLFQFRISIYLLFIAVILLMVLHILSLGGLPAFEGFRFQKISELVSLRASISGRAPSIWGYLSSINAKALVPFTLIVLLHQKRKQAFWVLLFFSAIYAFSLMQKSLILSMLFPVFIYCLLQKKYFLAGVNIGFSVGVILALVYVTNPQLRGGVNDIKPTENVKIASKLKETEEAGGITKAFSSLAHRIFIVPGEMVAEWFACIPTKKPFLYGNGYKIYTKFSGKKYHDYATELYPIIRPEYAEKDIQGSVNVASFMRAYSNFGIPGLIGSGIFLALFFIGIEALFGSDFKLKIALNIFPILLLSSGSLTTILLTGGWFFLLTLYILYKSNFKTTEKC